MLMTLISGGGTKRGDSNEEDRLEINAERTKVRYQNVEQNLTTNCLH
jgi:hypothetical protein